jgi:uncharacterized Zn-binding protein involved in type VI secretion
MQSQRRLTRLARFAGSQTDLNGKPIAGVGHKVSCPLCKGIFPIAEGSSTYTVDGTPIATA